LAGLRLCAAVKNQPPEAPALSRFDERLIQA